MLAWSFGWFFFLLMGYYVIRPFRETFGTSIIGTAWIPTMFLVVFVVMLAITPVYGALVSRVPRQRLVTIVYGFFSVWLLWFAYVRSKGSVDFYTACMFYVWVGVFNYFVVSVFWSFLTDIYSNEQGKRLFGIVSSGGTLGGLAGSMLTAKSLELAWLGPSGLMLFPIACLFCSLACMLQLHRGVRAEPANSFVAAKNPRPPRGTMFSGVVMIARSRYLLLITLALIATKFCATGPYMMQTEIVKVELPAENDQTVLFAKINFWTQALTFFLQTMVAGRCMKHLGLSISLCILPIIYALGFVGLSITSALWMLVVVQVAGRTIAFGLSTPAGEVLYTVVSRDERYKAKNFIDTVVSRGADAMASWSYVGLADRGLTTSMIAAWLAPVAVLWCSMAFVIGQMQKRRASGGTVLPVT